MSEGSHATVYRLLQAEHNSIDHKHAEHDMDHRNANLDYSVRACPSCPRKKALPPQPSRYEESPASISFSPSTVSSAMASSTPTSAEMLPPTIYPGWRPNNATSTHLSHDGGNSSSTDSGLAPTTCAQPVNPWFLGQRVASEIGVARQPTAEEHSQDAMGSGKLDEGGRHPN